MLGRYSIVRGRRIEDYPRRLRSAKREDTRKHTRHVLRPDAERVVAYLEAPGDEAWEVFAEAYRSLLAARYGEDPRPFDALAGRARQGDVYIGCSCPTAANPDPRRCHTTLALQFMHERYPDLEVEIP